MSRLGRVRPHGSVMGCPICKSGMPIVSDRALSVAVMIVTAGDVVFVV